MKIKLYHGTSSNIFRKIKEEGMPQGAYLTPDDEQALYYAQAASEEDDSSPLILVVEVHTDNLTADCPSFNEPLSFNLKRFHMNEEDWHEAIEKNQIPYPKPHDWLLSLEYTNSVLHSEAIDIKDIYEDASLSEDDLFIIDELIHPKNNKPKI